MKPLFRALALMTLAVAGCDDGSGNGPRPDSGVRDASIADSEPDAAPPLPRSCAPRDHALAPRNGYATGPSLKPTFRWSESPTATRYELEVDDSCDADFSTCSFNSPEIAESTTETSWSPESDLPVSSSAPVGRRYYWRVRPCGETECSDWSGVRYLDVGRTPKDFNGDGFADAAVGAETKLGGGRVYVYYGSPEGLPVDPDEPLDSPGSQDGAGFGSSLASADLNGDGFGDLIVGASGYDGEAAAEGRAFVYYGSLAGLPSAPDATLDNPDNEQQAYFGGMLADAGDLDGDGFSDLAVGVPSRGEFGGVFLYAGAAEGIAETPSQTLDYPDAGGGSFGESVSSVDFGGDGYADLFVGAPADDPERKGGAVYVYCGSPEGIGAPSVTLRPPDEVPDPSNMLFGGTLAGGDLDGNGLGDIVVGASQLIPPTVFVLLSTPPGLPTSPDVTLIGSRSFGESLATGDLDGDGTDDLAVGDSTANNGAAAEGEVRVYLGTPSGPAPVPTRTLQNPTHQLGGYFGTSVAMIGDADRDGDGELLVGAWGQQGSGQAFLYKWGPGGIPTSPDPTLSEPDGENGAGFGSSVAWAPFAPDANQTWFNGPRLVWLDPKI